MRPVPTSSEARDILEKFINNTLINSGVMVDMEMIGVLLSERIDFKLKEQFTGVFESASLKELAVLLDSVNEYLIERSKPQPVVETQVAKKKKKAESTTLPQ